MGFSDFHGNVEVVRRLREMLAHERFPQAIILAGPSGSGKYTLALMLAKAMNCLSPVTTDGLPDFCGVCANCVRIGQAEDLENRCVEAVEARENLRETDKKETRIFLQTHPDVLVIPPDPPQKMIKVDQVRRVIETIYFRPGEARERVYIFTDAAFMKEAANSLLKVLEEPPEFATIFLLAENPGRAAADHSFAFHGHSAGLPFGGRDRRLFSETSPGVETTAAGAGGTVGGGRCGASAQF